MRNARTQLLVGLLAIPLSLVPFVAYGTSTPQGRLMTDQLRIRFDPPVVDELDSAELDAVRSAAPQYAGQVMPLVYHGVGSQSSGEGGTVVSPDQFAEQLAALRAAAMNFVTAEEVADAFSGGRPLPNNAVLITFDDARADAVLWATPMLEEIGAKATMFVITGAADDPGLYYAGWDELDGSVWDVQSHSADLHVEQDTLEGSLPALTSRAAGESQQAWLRRVHNDLAQADAAIAEHTGRPPVAFAYPFGAWGGDRTNDPELAQLLDVELGQHYRLGFHQDGQDEMTLSGPDTPPLGLRRLQVGDWSGVELIEHIAAAAWRTESLRLIDAAGA